MSRIWLILFIKRCVFRSIIMHYLMFYLIKISGPMCKCGFIITLMSKRYTSSYMWKVLMRWIQHWFTCMYVSLQWRHNERDGVSNHQPDNCLLNRLFNAQIKENIKAPRHWPLWGEFAGNRWISRTKGQERGNCFHLMTSSCSDRSATYMGQVTELRLSCYLVLLSINSKTR